MREEVRRAIAHSVAARISGHSNNTVYSHGIGKHTYMTGNEDNFYDHDEAAHITGSGDNLYHYDTGNYIDLEVNGAAFSGYDYDSSSHFMGRVNGRLVQLYDYGEGQYFTYQA